jgi:hypothetical protein
MTGPFRADLPLPGPDRLVVYVLGPGFGESQVLIFPDGRCVVVDACRVGDINLPTALLKHLKISRIDLLVLTHPDQDHFLGFSELVRDFSPVEIWRYPFAGYVKDLVARWTQAKKSSARFRQLYEALESIERYCDKHGTGTEANHSTMSWRNESLDYSVQSLAPTNFDQARIRRIWDKIVEFDTKGEPQLSRFARRLLRGEVGIPLVANVLSLALAVRWGQWKILLGGDVENGNHRPYSGWKGVLAHADRHGHGTLVREVDLVKVAHHGSSRSFYLPAWQQHRKPDGSTLSAVTPFRTSSLPTQEVLSQLLPLSAKLGISNCDAGLLKRVAASGWVRNPRPAPSTWAPCLAVSFPASGPIQFFAAGEARWFLHPKPKSRPAKPKTLDALRKHYSSPSGARGGRGSRKPSRGRRP